MRVIMYTGNNCSKCKRAKAMLESCPVEVKLIERNIDEDEGHKEVLTRVYNSNTLPTFVVYDGKIVSHILRGFDENIGEIMDILGL